MRGFQSLIHDKLIGKVGKLIENAAAESVHAAAQAARAPTQTTALITVEDEPVFISTAAAHKATPPGGWISAAELLKKNLAAASISPLASLPGGATDDDDATGPAVRPGCPAQGSYEPP